MMKKIFVTINGRDNKRFQNVKFEIDQKNEEKQIHIVVFS